jgi:Ca-activated chloride channel family protein
MRLRLTLLPAVAALLACAGSASAHGLLIPEEKTVPPLAMLNHKVTIAIEDQFAVTRVEQTFRNHTDRNLEATYVFPVPKGASVNKFTMWVEGKETKGELLDAAKAREIYNGIVRRTQDPGLLEYIGNDLLQMRVFPIAAHSDQRVALSFTAVARKEGNLVEYVYPLKTDGKATATLEGFSVQATLKSQHSITNVYSPTHAITLKRLNDHEIDVQFDKNQALLDKDFQLFYSTGDKDVGLTALTHRPISTEPGFFTLLVSPKVEISKDQEVPRDMVFVLDTSGSMRGVKMDQARNALKYLLNNLGAKDRFALINFATSVNKYRDALLPADSEHLGQARKWVEALEATGGTAINDALATALDYRTKDEGRSFTIVFFTDGQPTIGETDVEKILRNTFAKNTANTRIFTFGVGDDVNATMLDRLAEGTRALATYVRPAEDIEAKVSGLCSKISHPVLTHLKVATTGDVSLSEVYPQQLPDLFHGGQLVVLGRYTGKGPSAIRLTGKVGMQTREFVYELTFPDKTKDERDFVEHLWARRKVGYLLDQIRVNGEKKELKDEVVALAKRYGITTPYTSWLIVPDGVVPVVGPGGPRPRPSATAPGLIRGEGKPAMPVVEFAKENQTKPGELAEKRGGYQDRDLAKGADKEGGKGAAKDKKDAYDEAARKLRERKAEEVQAGKLGVDLSIHTANLRNQSRVEMTANRQVQGRNVMELGGVWIDEGFDPKMPVVAVKAQSDAYFRILERQPQIKDVFRLGNHLVWVTPDGSALVVDTTDGKEKLDDDTIDNLFKAKK